MARTHVAAAALLATLWAGCTNSAPCPEPLETCDDSCYDLRSDRLNCGRCGHECSPGLACQGGTCVDAGGLSCATRTGGAFVTLGACGQAVKIWATSAPFIARAEALALDPASPGATTPVLQLRDATDCDGQWSWHVDPVTPSFGSPPLACDACPEDVEAARAYWVLDVEYWCPADARVLSVDRR